MIKVLFVCHGNICRSTMAEFVFKDMVKKENLEDKFLILSAATSDEEIGNHIHSGTRRKLKEVGVIFDESKTAVRIKKSDYDKFDYIIGMDSMNVVNMKKVFGGDPDGKIFKLLYFSGLERDIADPWYTGNFDITYEDIVMGLSGFLKAVTATPE
ncbi:MAG: low molecular weight phosphotyrosine protein phosphatase [Clostridiales bacterium]|nr:low molecular weight phosphotyrosine protein phosphatase [Clostridiales bacterium]